MQSKCLLTNPRSRRRGLTFCLNRDSFKDALMNAGADDVDDFTKILLSAVLGKEVIARWFTDRGGALE